MFVVNLVDISTGEPVEYNDDMKGYLNIEASLKSQNSLIQVNTTQKKKYDAKKCPPDYFAKVNDIEIPSNIISNAICFDGFDQADFNANKDKEEFLQISVTSCLNKADPSKC